MSPIFWPNWKPLPENLVRIDGAVHQIFRVKISGVVKRCLHWFRGVGGDGYRAIAVLNDQGQPVEVHNIPTHVRKGDRWNGCYEMLSDWQECN